MLVEGFHKVIIVLYDVLAQQVIKAWISNYTTWKPMEVYTYPRPNHSWNMLFRLSHYCVMLCVGKKVVKAWMSHNIVIT